MKTRLLFSALISVLVLGCEKTDEDISFNNLQDLMDYYNYSEADEVIACAGSNRLNDSISIFFYPEEGAKDFRYHEAFLNADENDYSSYQVSELYPELLLNKYLKAFKRDGDTEAWGIVSYMVNGRLHASNPIRLKQLSKRTEYNNSLLSIDFTTVTSPRFLWEDGQIKENEIFYEIVMTQSKEVLSATYTYSKAYQYYDVSNVVLDLTNPSPPRTLESGKDYTIAIMGVSIDNWINLFIETPFNVPTN